MVSNATVNRIGLRLQQTWNVRALQRYERALAGDMRNFTAEARRIRSLLFLFHFFAKF
jgi:hypothetical protein